ncbi:MAG: hypothetical protein FD166_1250 [Bacteroidetes bacterium]|nr:MAG: hypothetical protein FD166_1250 [Bacteroidota bacterium]
MNRILQILIIAVLVSSCKSTDQRISDQFKNNYQLFVQIKLAAFKDKILNSNLEKLTSVDKLEPKTIKTLEKLSLNDISYLILSKTDCLESKERSIEIIFSGQWHLQYFPCDELKLKKGEHKIEGNIESWALDNNWIVWVNHDIIG